MYEENRRLIGEELHGLKEIRFCKEDGSGLLARVIESLVKKAIKDKRGLDVLELELHAYSHGIL